MKKIFLLFTFTCLTSCIGYLSDPALDSKYFKAVEEQDWEIALKCATEKLKRHPQDSILYYEKSHLTNLVYPDQFHKNIITDLDVFLDFESSSIDARILKYQCHIHLQQYHLAIKEIEALESLLGISKASLIQKANAHFQNKDFDKAAFLYDDLLKFNHFDETRKFIYYQNIYSKFFSGNKEGASWDTAFLEQRGFKSDSLLMDKIHKETLKFQDVPITNHHLDKGELENIANQPLGLDYDRIYRPIYGQLLFQSGRKKVEELKDLDKNIELLNLSYLNLHRLPEVLFTFKNLKAINLSGNDFYDYNEVIQQLATFPKLEYLELNRCNLREFPSSIKKLKNLKGLSISSTNLKKLSPDIAYLRKLSYLDISSIPRLYELPEQISYLKNLNVLKVSGGGMRNLRNELATCYQLNAIVANASRITSIPQDIGNLKHLKLMNLAACRLKEIPISIGECTYLDDLSLGSNDLCDIPETVGNLKYLESLSLEFNRFKEFPIAVIKNKNLIRLHVHNNNFTEIPIKVTTLNKLTHLLVDHQLITQQNIDSIKDKGPDIYVVPHDSQRYVSGKRRKIPCQ